MAQDGNPQEENGSKEHTSGATMKERPQNPLKTASLVSRMLFMWPYPLLKLGMTRPPLEELDLPAICDVDTSSANRLYFERIWEEEQRLHPNNPSLHRVILKDFFKSIWFVQPLYMMAAAAKVAQAVSLGLLIQSFEDGTDGIIWASVIVCAGLIILFEHHHVFFITWRKGYVLLQASIYNRLFSFLFVLGRSNLSVFSFIIECKYELP